MMAHDHRFDAFRLFFIVINRQQLSSRANQPSAGKPRSSSPQKIDTKLHADDMRAKRCFSCWCGSKIIKMYITTHRWFAWFSLPALLLLIEQTITPSAGRFRLLHWSALPTIAGALSLFPPSTTAGSQGSSSCCRILFRLPRVAKGDPSVLSLSLSRARSPFLCFLPSHPSLCAWHVRVLRALGVRRRCKSGCDAAARYHGRPSGFGSRFTSSGD